MQWKKQLCLMLGLLVLSTSFVVAKYVETPITPLGVYEKGGYLPDTGDVWIDKTGVIVSSFKWINPQFGNYFPETYYEHEFRVENDPNKNKISYGGQYIINLPDGYVDPDDLGVGGNAEKIVDGKWYYSYVWISGPSGVYHTNCYLEGEEGVYFPWAPSQGYPKRYYTLVGNIEFYMGSDSQVYTWNKNFEESFVSSSAGYPKDVSSKRLYALLLKEEATLEEVEQLLSVIPKSKVDRIETIITTNNSKMGTITVGFKVGESPKGSYLDMISKISSLITSLESKFMADGYLDENEKTHLEFLRTTKEKMLEKLKDPKIARVRFKIIVGDIEYTELQKLKDTNEVIEHIGGTWQ